MISAFIMPNEFAIISIETLPPSRRKLPELWISNVEQ